MKFEIGTDILDISRVDSVFRRHGFPFLFRILRPCEIFLTLKSAHFIESNLLESIESKSKFIESALKKYNKFHKDSKNPYFDTKKLENLDSKIFKNYDENTLLESFSLESFRFQTIAGFFSIKEAASKALGSGISSKLSFKDMCIFKDKNGKPHLKLNKNKKQLWNLKNISISISHDNNSVISVCAVILK